MFIYYYKKHTYELFTNDLTFIFIFILEKNKSKKSNQISLCVWFIRQLYDLGNDDENGTRAPSAWIGGIELTDTSNEQPSYSWVKLGLGGTGLASSDTFWNGDYDGTSVHKV